MQVVGPARRLLPPWPDAALAIVLALLIQQDLWLLPDLGHRVGPRGLVALCYAASSLALAWRRRAPVVVLGAVWTVSSVQALAFGAAESLGIFLPPLIALYSVGRHAPTRAGAVALPVSAVGTAIHEWRDPVFSFAAGPTYFFWAILGLAWPLGQALRRRALAIGTLSERAVELERARDEQTRAAIVAERARIARELHDVVGHGLTVVVLQLEAALGLLDGGDPAGVRDRLVGVQRSARLALAEMRRLVGLIDADEASLLAPQPGLADLDRLIADTRAAGVQLEAATCGTPTELSPGLDLAAFRVAQEALTNVARHAHPPIARLSVSYAPAELVVEVSDAGTTRNGQHRAGRGITGMRERVALYGGELEVGPRRAGGFVVRARFPLDANR
jgi:signal transduction histidine kinase